MRDASSRSSLASAGAVRPAVSSPTSAATAVISSSSRSWSASVRPMSSAATGARSIRRGEEDVVLDRVVGQHLAREALPVAGEGLGTAPVGRVEIGGGHGQGMGPTPEGGVDCVVVGQIGGVWSRVPPRVRDHHHPGRLWPTCCPLEAVRGRPRKLVPGVRSARSRSSHQRLREGRAS